MDVEQGIVVMRILTNDGKAHFCCVGVLMRYYESRDPPYTLEYALAELLTFGWISIKGAQNLFMTTMRGAFQRGSGSACCVEPPGWPFGERMLWGTAVSVGRCCILPT